MNKHVVALDSLKFELPDFYLFWNRQLLLDVYPALPLSFVFCLFPVLACSTSSKLPAKNKTVVSSNFSKKIRSHRISPTVMGIFPP